MAENAQELGIDPSRLVVAGDSAGGNLAAVVAQIAREEKKPEIIFQALIYPAVDIDLDRWPSYEENANAHTYYNFNEMVLPTLCWHNASYR